jgi:hypothetical protein
MAEPYLYFHTAFIEWSRRVIVSCVGVEHADFGCYKIVFSAFYNCLYVVNKPTLCNDTRLK